MMKIIFSSNVSWSIYNFRKDLLKSLQNQGNEIYTVSSKDHYAHKLTAEGFFFKEIDINNNSKNPLRDIILTFKYYKIYKEIKPDLICHNAIKPNIFGTIAAKLLGIPVINNISGLGTLFIKKSFSTFLAKALYRLSQRFAATVFFQNPDDSQFFIQEKLIRKSKIRLIPGSGVDTTLFIPSQKKIKGLFNFIFIGRLLKDKGLIELYEAVIELSEKRDDFIVTIVGDRYTSNQTCISQFQLRLFETNDKFNLIGHTDDVRQQLKDKDCLILPSYREGLSKVLIEAGSSGIPCITTNVPGCKDVIIDNYNGLLIQPKCSKSLMVAMDKMLNFNHAKLLLLGENARKNVIEKFSMEIVNSIYLEEINKTLMHD